MLWRLAYSLTVKMRSTRHKPAGAIRWPFSFQARNREYALPAADVLLTAAQSAVAEPRVGFLAVHRIALDQGRDRFAR